MCRSIKVLRQPGCPATAEDISAAALQFVRKISGFRTPARSNEQAFNHAVQEISDASQRLLDLLGTRKAAPESRTTVTEAEVPSCSRPNN